MNSRSSNAPKRHHYVPQFYLRRFAAAGDRNKVGIAERHGEIVATDVKSIGSIGYEEGLHDFEADGATGSIEQDLNKSIETPFSISRTWSRIEEGDTGKLDAVDALSIYGFARHLQRRNVRTLRFLEAEHARFAAGEIDDLSEDERRMHAWIAQQPGRPHELFREGAMDTELSADAHAINVIVCRSTLPFRTSVNPTLMISHPGRPSVFGAMFNSLRTWWLTLDRHCGAFLVAGGPAGFTNSLVQDEIARLINRQYLVQFLHGDSRYLVADDPHLEADLEWAGFAFDRRTTHGARYRPANTVPAEALAR